MAFDDLPPGYSASDVVGGDLPPGYKASDVISKPKKSAPVFNAQGKSTYMPSEAAGPTPGATPFNRTREMNQQNIARSAAEQNIAVMPKGFSKRVQPITQDTEQNFNPAQGTGKFGSAGTPKVPQQLTKIGGEEVGRQPVFTGGQGLADVLQDTEYGKRVRAVLEDPDAPQWAKALAQLNMNLQGFATPLNVAAAGVTGGVASVLPKRVAQAGLGAAGVGFGAPIVASGVNKLRKGETGAGIADIATGGSMAVPGAMGIRSAFKAPPRLTGAPAEILNDFQQTPQEVSDVPAATRMRLPGTINPEVQPKRLTTAPPNQFAVDSAGNAVPVRGPVENANIVGAGPKTETSVAIGEPNSFATPKPKPVSRLPKPTSPSTPAPTTPPSTGEGQAPLLDAQGREYVQTGVDAKGKPILKIKPKEQTNAVPVQKPDEGVLRQEGPQVGLQGVVKGNAKPESTPEQGQAQGEPQDLTSARKAMMAQDREALDLPELPDAERKSWQTTLENAQDKNLNQTASDLANQIVKKPRSLNDEETAGMVLRAQEIKNLHKEASQAIADAQTPEETSIAKARQDALQNEFDTLSAALKKSGTEKGRTLASQKLTINQDYDLVSVKSRMKAANPDKPLSAQEETQATAQTDRIAELENRISELEKKSAIRTSLNRAAQNVPKEFGKNNSIFTEDRANAARLRIQDKLGRLSAGIDPTLLKDVVEVGGYYVEGGLRSFASWAKQMKTDFPRLDDDHIKAAWSELTNDKRLEASKKALATSLSDVNQRIAEGGTEKLRPPKVVLDKEAMQMRNDLNTAKGKLDAMIEARRPKSLTERALALHREFILSGYSVFEKLLGATAWNLPVESLADFMGAGIGKVSGLGKIASREGKFSLGSEAKGYTGLLSKQAFRNAKDMLLTGTNQISQMAGYKAKANELGGFMGRVHGTEKSFLQTAQFDKSLDIRLKKLAEQGKDVNNPEVQFQAATGAAMDAQSQILQNDNALATGINNAIGTMQRNSSTGVKVLGAFFRTLAPITRVPANYLGRGAEMTGLGGVTGAVKHISALREVAKTGEPMPPQVADSILRSYKYGGIGLVAAYIGLTQPDWFKSAGFFGKTQNTDTQGKKMEGDTLQIGGHTVPRVLSHSPFALAVQFWATMRNEVNRGNPVNGVQRGILGMAEQMPGAVSVSQMAHAPNLQQAAGRYTGNLIMPQLAQQGAKLLPGPANKPHNFGEEIMTKTPGLRQMVPAQSSTRGSSFGSGLLPTTKRLRRGG